ncbi:MAG: metal-dependent hydrolase [Planctomycetaceae bacterium]|nr:metal-dependent hydrolase [Planctomycetaceae bacterium]
MSVSVRWLGHACWEVRHGEQSILIDPFLNESPTAPCKAEDLSPDLILITHGHFDHIADAASIAIRTGSPVLACYEIATWLTQQHQVPNTIGMNLGGGIDLQWVRVKFVQAWHSSQLPDGSYGGNPGGFIIELADKRIYLAGDTALFSDMKLIGEEGLDVAILPIGDNYTMGPSDSVRATKFLSPKQVIPCHFDTWPPIAQDAQAWAHEIRSQTMAQPIVLAPGESFQLN